MPKVKIDKKALKENELETALIQFRDFVTQNPKKIIIPLGIVILAVAITIVSINYFKSQSQQAQLDLLRNQLQYKSALTTADKSQQIVGLNRSLDGFKKMAKENSFSSPGKIAGVYVGDCYYHLNRYDEAIKAYQEAISKGAPKLPAAWAQMSIGYCYLSKSDYKSALPEFEKVTKSYPESFLVPSAKLQMGLCYEKQNDKVKAREIYQSVIKTYPDSTLKNEAEARLAALSEENTKPTSG
jgi:tetratricopeptide (TPR) repeat protein